MKLSNRATRLVSAMALVGCTGVANAGLIDTVSYSNGFSFGSTNVTDNESSNSNNSIAQNSQNRNVSLSGFDSSLGTLLGVQIGFDTNWSLTGNLQANDIDQWYNWAEQTGGSAYAGGNYSITLVDPAGASNVSAEATHLSCYNSGTWWPSNVKCSDTESDSGAFDGTMDISSIDLAEFLDDDISFNITRLLTAEITGCGDGDDYCSVTNKNNAWAGELTISYVYDVTQPEEVPEPGSLAMFGLGLIGLGLARRKNA